MRVKPLLDSIRHRIGGLDKTVWVEAAIFLMLAICFLFFIKPMVNSAIGSLRMPWLPSDRISLACMVFFAIGVIVAFGLRRRIDVFCLCVVVLCGLILVSTVYNEGDVLIVVTDWLPCVATVMLVALNIEKRARSLVGAFFVACMFYLLMNLYCLLRSSYLIGFDSLPDLFFGYRNVTFRAAIPAFACSLVLDALGGKRGSIRTATVYVLCVFELAVAYSATAMCAFALMGMLWVVLRFDRKGRILNAVTYAGGYCALFLGFVVMRVQNMLGFIIEPVLQRSVTFTGRTEIWDGAFQYISSGSHFLTGYGTGYMRSLLSAAGGIQKHAHNDLLHAFLLGGIGAALSLVAMVVLVVQNLYRGRASRLAASLSIGLAGFLLASLVEVSMCAGFCFILAFSFYSDFSGGDGVPKHQKSARAPKR